MSSHFTCAYVEETWEFWTLISSIKGFWARSGRGLSGGQVSTFDILVSQVSNTARTDLFVKC